jgi:hypothetical protein
MKLEDLQKFCSTNETRPTLHHPFNKQGFTYATDARIMVKVPLIEGTLDVPGSPSMEVLDANIPKEEGIPVEYPPAWESFEPDIAVCSTCKGTGAIRECRACEGSGETTCPHCDHEATCDECRGRGHWSVEPLSPQSELCEHCEGKGKIENTLAVSLNRGLMFVDFRLLQKVHTLPNVKAFICQSPKVNLVHFTFKGGEGVVMLLSNVRKSEETTAQQWKREEVTA